MGKITELKGGINRSMELLRKVDARRAGRSQAKEVEQESIPAAEPANEHSQGSTGAEASGVVDTVEETQNKKEKALPSAFEID